jgi:predicted RNA-binding Zn ribbon-like protein
MSATSRALFLADHPALDFMNTHYGPPHAMVEVIPDGAAFVSWLVEAGWLDSAAAPKLKRRLGASALNDVATEARALRQWASEWIERWAEDPAADYAAEVRRLNGVLAHERGYVELVERDESLTLQHHVHLDSPAQVLARVAEPLAELMANAPANLVKRCGGSDCTLWFLDKTKSHRRLFCSAAACGNRAKVAAFRERQRT